MTYSVVVVVVVKQCVTYSMLLSGMLLVVKQCVTYSVVVVKYAAGGEAVCDSSMLL